MDDMPLSMQLLIWVTEKVGDDEEGGPAPSIVSTVCPTPHALPKQLPSMVHDERGNTLYEEPSIAWMHVRVSQVRTPAMFQAASDILTAVLVLQRSCMSACHVRKTRSLIVLLEG